ncbi:FAD-dependent oxidoreductase [Mycolicibacterium sp. BiH015]|uniref:NAD(P)/FAD-dependent oxidoreductase n=1 Tax=Mycolicibacterium sp. BiH015 TaxID=3018808 RepID=UPI0022E37A86|nr:FAD-dependent oxidoreductase [Mycolicibacterium sp. BiH015]MDA2893292.1 FAD-dependent oxidoreductase [Mycolicibacterium sp. BiH015]
MTSPHREEISTDVAIVGAGPAGLTAARRLAAARHDVLVLDREQYAGGIPRHSDHLGYGIRDLKTFISGPAYAARLAATATTAGARIRTRSMVTAINDDNTLEVTAPSGLVRVRARAVVLATGARERPRPARLIPGDRPAGVYTTGHLQNVVHLHHGRVGTRAVVVGAELVSWSAVMTLRHAGADTVLMLTQFRSPESYAAFNFAGKAMFRVPIAIRSRVTRIIGRPRVEAVEVEDLDTGARRRIACDTVVLTGDWIPDHELARSAGLDMDSKTLGPLVDNALRTSRPGLFAAGNLLHPVDTADIAALDGRHVAEQVDRYLDGSMPRPTAGVRLQAGPALRWLAPGLLRPGAVAPPRNRLLAWTDQLVRFPKVTLTQGGLVIAHKRLAWPASPGRVFRIPASVLGAVDPDGGPVTVDIANVPAGNLSVDRHRQPAAVR